MTTTAAKCKYTASLDEWWRKVALFAYLLCISTSRTLAAVTTDAVLAGATTAAAVAPATVPLAGAGAGGATRKRISLRSVDPLTRRSAVDKHFIRFGRNNEHDGAGIASYLADKSINLRKREIFQSRADDDGDRVQSEATQRLLRDHTLSLQAAAQPALNPDCFSSLAAFQNRTCFGRLRVGHRHRQSVPRRMQLKSPPARHGGHLQSDYEDDYDIRRLAAAGKYEYEGDDENADVEVGADNENSYDKNDDKVSDDRGAAALRLAHRIWHATSSSKSGNDIADASDDPFVRTIRNKLVNRNLFSRYDRGRDNFMRLGRSQSQPVDDNSDDMVSEQKTWTTRIGGEDSIDGDFGVQPLGDDDDDDGRRTKRSAAETAATPVERFKRKHDSFMRLGRKHDSNFMRLGRAEPRSSFIRYGRDGHDASGDYDRWTRKHDNFMRLGRGGAGGGEHRRLRAQTKREKAQNFMRLGRRDRDNNHNDDDDDDDEIMAHSHDTPRLGPVFMMTPRHLRRSDNFVRFGRDKFASFDGQTLWNLPPRPDDDDTPPPVLTLSVPQQLSRFRRQVVNHQHQQHHHHHHHQHEFSSLNDTGSSSEGWSLSPTNNNSSSSSSIKDRDRNRDVLKSLRDYDDASGNENAILVATPVDVSSSASRHPYLVSLSRKPQSSLPPSSLFNKREVTSYPSLASTTIPLPVPAPIPNNE